MPKFLRALSTYDGEARTRLGLHLAVLFFVRTTELRAARWDEVDLETAEWRIPAERMKMRAPHIVPLSRQAIETFVELRSPRASLKRRFWRPANGPVAHIDAPTRLLAAGDELLVNDYRVKIAGRSKALPRWPPRPLLYTTFSNAARILLPERRRLTFVLATAEPGVPPRELAARIQAQAGFRARASDDFEADTVRWFLINSEDVEETTRMLFFAMSVGFGVTGVMLYMFTHENLK